MDNKEIEIIKARIQERKDHIYLLESCLLDDGKELPEDYQICMNDEIDAHKERVKELEEQLSELQPNEQGPPDDFCLAHQRHYSNECPECVDIKPKTMDLNTIKKELYKQKRDAKFVEVNKSGMRYVVTIADQSGPTIARYVPIGFFIPISDIGDATFEAVMPSHLLIRYLVMPERTI